MKKSSFSKQSELVGFYCWAGPGTIRMLDTKYFNPEVNEASVMSSYQPEYLHAIKNTLGVTDIWATYSWGFNKETEQPDRAFLLDRLSHFKKAGIRVHAYLQGTNLVTDQFPEKDWWARDNYDRYIPYAKGRRLTCINNPDFQDYFFAKVSQLAQTGVDGIFVDNVHMGQIAPLWGEYPVGFVGCRCQFCLEAFQTQHQAEIPKLLHRTSDQLREAYYQFREDSLFCFLKKISQISRKKGKLFGTNSYDPKFDMRVVYGFTYQNLVKIQDYLLFETHSFPHQDGSTRLEIADQIAKNLDIPVFTVTYNRGIGYEPQFDARQIALLLHDADTHAFFACLKGSEFTTDGVWHNLFVDEEGVESQADALREVHSQKNSVSTDRQELAHTKEQNALDHLAKRIGRPLWVYDLLNFLSPQLVKLIMENKLARPLLRLVYKVIIR